MSITVHVEGLIVAILAKPQIADLANILKYSCYLAIFVVNTIFVVCRFIGRF